MFSPVSAAPAERPASGLVASAITPNDGVRWETGMAWRPERCPTAVGFDPSCGLESPFGATSGAGDTANTYYLPMAFRVELTCSTRGQRQPEDEARVRRQAEAITSYMVARELQNGALSRATPYTSPLGAGQVNHYLADSATVVEAGTWEPYAGLGRLEELARQDALGQDVFLHIPIRLVPLLRNALVARGNLLYTQAGARVVADAGYDGGGPLSAGTAEVQTVTITGSPTGGTFTLTWNGQTTAPIAFNASAATVQAALEALSNIAPGDVSVAGSAGGPWTVTFNDRGNVAQMTASGAGLTGGTAPAVGVATTTPGVAPAPTAGTWMYATGPVQVRLAPIEFNSMVVWADNRYLITADRLFAATYDPCNAHALAVTVPATS